MVEARSPGEAPLPGGLRDGAPLLTDEPSGRRHPRLPDLDVPALHPAAPLLHLRCSHDGTWGRAGDRRRRRGR
jgi:hypothetical protein